MSIPHPSTDPATPGNVITRDQALQDLAELRRAADRLARERAEAEARVLAEEERLGDAAFIVAERQRDLVDAREAMDLARRNEAQANACVAELAAEVWA